MSLDDIERRGPEISFDPDFDDPQKALWFRMGLRQGYATLDPQKRVTEACAALQRVGTAGYDPRMRDIVREEAQRVLDEAIPHHLLIDEETTMPTETDIEKAERVMRDRDATASDKADAQALLNRAARHQAKDPGPETWGHVVGIAPGKRVRVIQGFLVQTSHDDCYACDALAEGRIQAARKQGLTMWVSTRISLPWIEHGARVHVIEDHERRLASGGRKKPQEAAVEATHEQLLTAIATWALKPVGSSQGPVDVGYRYAQNDVIDMFLKAGVQTVTIIPICTACGKPSDDLTTGGKERWCGACVSEGEPS